MSYGHDNVEFKVITYNKSNKYVVDPIFDKQV